MTSNIVVINKVTKEFVVFRLNKHGEVVITSTDPLDTEENCIVTTWDEITHKNILRKGAQN